MAGSIAADSASAQPQLEQAVNLLDVVLERVAKAGKSHIITRIILVTRLAKGKETSASSQQSVYHRLIEKHAVGEGGEITGLLMVYPICSVHVLEAKTNTILALLRDIAAHVPDIKASESRVISCTEDIPGRHFNNWYSTFVPSTSAAEVMDPLDAFGAVKTASEINAFFRKVGPALIAPHDGETQRRLASLDAYYDEVPALEAILSLCPTEDAPTLDEFLDIFDGPVNVDLESEQVWPMPPPLQF